VKWTGITTTLGRYTLSPKCTEVSVASQMSAKARLNALSGVGSLWTTHTCKCRWVVPTGADVYYRVAIEWWIRLRSPRRYTAGWNRRPRTDTRTIDPEHTAASATTGRRTVGPLGTFLPSWPLNIYKLFKFMCKHTLPVIFLAEVCSWRLFSICHFRINFLLRMYRYLRIVNVIIKSAWFEKKVRSMFLIHLNRIRRK
jgi:hypothetical protein